MRPARREEGGRAKSATLISDLLRDAALDQENSLSGQIYDLLRDLIVTVKILPGQLISEKELSEILHASKTPVREALIRLENEGLVNIVPKSGTYVAPLSVSHYLDACFVRLNLEIGAVRACAAVEDKSAHLARLRGIIAEQKRAFSEDRDVAFFELDEVFHKALFAMAGVPEVWETVRRSQAHVYRVRHFRRLKNIRNGAKVIADHEAIVEAIERGSAPAAEAALVAHIGSLDAKIESLASQPALLASIKKLNSTPARAQTARVAEAAARRG